jgi:hypothetical protein
MYFSLIKISTFSVQHFYKLFYNFSAKYDLNLVKQKLAKHLNMHQQEHGFVVKKSNAYACISSRLFRFLDISHFLAPGTSYAGFLKAYRVEEAKGFFPYE